MKTALDVLFFWWTTWFQVAVTKMASPSRRRHTEAPGRRSSAGFLRSNLDSSKCDSCRMWPGHRGQDAPLQTHFYKYSGFPKSALLMTKWQPRSIICPLPLPAARAQADPLVFKACHYTNSTQGFTATNAINIAGLDFNSLPQFNNYFLTQLQLNRASPVPLPLSHRDSHTWNILSSHSLLFLLCTEGWNHWHRNRITAVQNVPAPDLGSDLSNTAQINPIDPFLLTLKDQSPDSNLLQGILICSLS